MAGSQGGDKKSNALVRPHLLRVFFTPTAYTFGIARTNFSPLILPTLNVTAFTLHHRPVLQAEQFAFTGRYAPAIQNETPAKSLTFALGSSQMTW